MKTLLDVFIVFASVSAVAAASAKGSRLGGEVFVLDNLPLPQSTGAAGRQLHSSLGSHRKLSKETDVKGNVRDLQQRPSLSLSDFENTTVTQLVDNGFGHPLNKYSWSSTLATTGEYCIGTLNANMVSTRLGPYIARVFASQSPYLAARDAGLRYFSGSPVSYSEGAEIWCMSTNGGSIIGQAGQKYKQFKRVFKAPAEHVGFRRMIEYKGKLYAGSANGPDGPDRDLDTASQGKASTFNFGLEDWNPFNFENVLDRPMDTKLRIAPYFTNSIQEDVYGPETNATLTQGTALFSGWPNGTGWAKMKTDLFTTWDRSIRAMCVSTFSNRMFFGTESLDAANGGNGAKIIINDGNDLTLLTQIPEALAVAVCGELTPGKMMFGTWGQGNVRIVVVDETNGDAVTIVNNSQLATFKGVGVMELRVFNKELFVGVFDFFSGFTLARTSSIDNLDAATWTIITNNGFKEAQQEQLGKVVSHNAYPWSAVIVGDVYYLGTFAIEINRPRLDTRGQLWATRDGENWLVIEDYGFGQEHTYGFRTMQTDGEKLYIGTASSIFVPVYSEKPYDKVNLIKKKKSVPLAKPFKLVG